MNEFQIVVKGSTGTLYDIKKGKDGVVYCTCPAWRFQKLPVAARTCKHIKSVSAQLVK